MNLDNDWSTLAASQFDKNTGELTIQTNDPDFPSSTNVWEVKGDVR
jgi:hypothetical protein